MYKTIHKSVQPPLPPAPVGAAPVGAPPGLVLATSIAPSDTSTSTVLTDLTGPQVELGKADLDTHLDVVYSTPTGPDGQPLPLKLDLQLPRAPGRTPLVVYVTGGGFVMAEKENGPTTRTYLAEAGYAVASIQYRTVLNGATYLDGVADVKAAVRYLRAPLHPGRPRRGRPGQPDQLRRRRRATVPDPARHRRHDHLAQPDTPAAHRTSGRRRGQHPLPVGRRQPRRPGVPR